MPALEEDPVNLNVGFDPFSDDKEDKSASAKDHVHIRVQQRNGRKSLTTVQAGVRHRKAALSDFLCIFQGIKGDYDYKRILKALKKEYCCNGTVVEDEELGQVIQVQGDQRKNVADFLASNKIVKRDHIKVHGF